MNSVETIIQTTVKQEGIDLIGFAGRDRFANVDPQHNPFSIFPEGKTVILLGKRICRGALRGVEEGTNFGDYNLFGVNWLEDEFLSLACYNLVRALEDAGWEAVPLFPNPTEVPPSCGPVAEDRPAPNVFPDFDYAAVACGLAEIGLNGLVLTPQFGSRQRFHMIITDAELPATPLLERSVCTKCGKCAEACPLGAIDLENTREIDICGKRMTVANIDYSICRTCKNGACVNRMYAGAKPDRVAALSNRTCLHELEQAGALDNQFERPFRKRDAWSIGEKRPVAGDGSEKNNVLGGVFSADGNRGAK